MLSLTKVFQSTKLLLNTRIAASLHGANNFATAQEKLGLPPKPKRPLTPFFRFLGENRQKLQKEKPDLKLVEIVKELSKQWATTDEATRKRYSAAYLKEYAIYQQARLKYDIDITPEQKAALKEIKEDKIKSRERHAYLMKIRENGKPRKPATGFLRYLKLEHDKLKGTSTYMEIQKKAAQTWDALPEEKKKVYNDMFANENVKYKQDLAAWELKMIRVGNLDLVRSDALIDDPKSSRKPKVHRGPRKQSSDSD